MKTNNISYAVTNARSLAPKINSLSEHFSEYDLDFAIVSETWYITSAIYRDVCICLEHEKSIKSICCNRKERKARNTGGGVGIHYRTGKIQLSYYPFRREGCKVMAAKGKLPRTNCSLFVIGLYIPPGLTKPRINVHQEILTELLEKIKREERNPHIVIGCDTNKYDLHECLDEHLHLSRLDTPPTRNGECLDEVFTNLAQHTTDIQKTTPLENDNGVHSDHDILIIQMSIPQQHESQWITFYARDLRKENKAAFMKEYSMTDWEDLIGEDQDVDSMTTKLHRVISRLTDHHFPLKKRKIRSTDDPWINDQIRHAIQRRMRTYKKYKRVPKWIQAKALTDDLIKAAKSEYYTAAVRKLSGDKANQILYRILKDVAIPDRPTAWTITHLSPEDSELELANKLAQYFVRITDEFDPLTDAPPVTYERPFDMLDPLAVAKMIRSGKKPKTGVHSDILPSMTNDCADITAVPATRIMNFCLDRGLWPAPWRLVTQSAIPKKQGADTFDQSRNLFCANGLSKVLESVVLERLLQEVNLRRNQYGGIRGCSTNYFLIKMWDSILRGLDEPGTAVSLVSIDFSKAFNRVDHSYCLQALAEEGASTHSLRMVSAFLKGCRMRFKVNNVYSDEKNVNEGSPQGTRLGNFLFIVAVNKIEDSWQ